MFKREFVGTAPDYSDKKLWLAMPESPDMPVDVIYLYPSSCHDPEAGDICAIDDPSMMETAGINFAHQAAVFEPLANIYAPYWRQVNAEKLPLMSFEEVSENEWAEPRTDVYAALDYYFENLNDGRPYFLAGHSQGSRLLYMTLSEYMSEHPEYYANMIAAYCIGDSLTKEYLAENPHVKAAQGAEDTGVVVSWNTEGPANKGRNSLVVAPGAIAINPLNWCTDETPAGAELNLGTFVPHLTDAGMDELSVRADAVLDLERGSVMVTNPEFEKYAITAMPGFEAAEPVFGPASYHGCDYSFFFLNIRENALRRAAAWYGLIGDLYTYQIGLVTVSTNVSKEEAEKIIRERLRESAKDAAVSAVISAKAAKKSAVKTLTVVRENLKAAAEESKPKIEEGMKKFKEDMRKSIDAAKPVIEKASKDVGEFIEEVKEEVKASEK